MNNPPTSQKGMSSQNESTQAFAKLPKVFFNEKAPQYPQYKHLTAQHILAYTLMRDRLQLSIIKQMQDENGTPFICYDLRNVAADVRCGEKKAGQLVNDLDNMGLIHKVRQGLGKPNRIYVHDVLETEPSKRLDRTRSKDGQEPQEEQLKSCQENIAEPSNGQTRPVEGTVPEQSNGQSNKTDKNKTEISKTDNSNTDKNKTEISKTDNSNTDSNDTEISKTDNSNYSVNGNERALDGGLMTSDAKDYLLARNEESLVDEVRRLLFKLMRMTPKTICIDNREMNSDVVSERLKNISITQIETALNRVEGNKYSEEERREHLTAELYHVTQETSNQTVQAGITDSSYQTASQTSNTDALAGISKETQEQNEKELEQMYAEFGDLWN